jgi:hypothetical protein
MTEGSDSNRPVVVAAFTGVPEAEIARSALEAEGIEAILQGDQLIGVAWHLSNAVGGVRVVVPAAQEERARAVLAGLDPGQQAEVEAGEEEAAPALDAAGGAAAGPEEGPADLLAKRAWLSTLIGFLILPPLLHLWSLWLLLQARRAGGPRTEAGKRFAFRAVAVDLLVLCAIGAVIAVANSGPAAPRPRRQGPPPHRGTLFDVGR